MTSQLLVVEKPGVPGDNKPKVTSKSLTCILVKDCTKIYTKNSG